MIAFGVFDGLFIIVAFGGLLAILIGFLFALGVFAFPSALCIITFLCFQSQITQDDLFLVHRGSWMGTF